jgi:amino acid adenylation domain-containing protein
MTLVTSNTVEDRARALLGEEYWDQTLRKDVPDLSLPWASERAAGGARVTLERTLDAELLARVHKMANGSPLLTATFIATSLAWVIDRYTETHEFVFGAADLDAHSAGGPVFVRLAIDAQQTFKQLFVHTRTRLQQAIGYKDVAIDALLAAHESRPEQRARLQQVGLCGFATAAATRAAFDLCFLVDAATGRLGVELSPERNTPAQLERLLDQLLLFIAGAVATPYAAVETIDLVGATERRLVLEQFNARRAPLPDKLVPFVVAEQAGRTPARIAVELGKQRMTYGELEHASNRIAARLRATIAARSIVAIIMDRSPDMVAAILGTWKAGCAYVPLDPAAPEARNRDTLDSAQPALVITEARYRQSLAPLFAALPLLDLDADRASLTQESPASVAQAIAPGDLAYVIFTSGSTGRPKGAMIEHAGMLNHMFAKVRELELDENSVVAQNASQCFDISVWQLFCALCCGGKTVIYPHHTVLDVETFLDDVARHVTILELVPSYFRLLLDSLDRRPRPMQAMRVLILNAETLQRSLVERWFRLYPGVPMINAYGPTEASDDVLHHWMRGLPIPDNIPIGRPIQNMNLYVVDSQTRPCPIGVKGAILVSGIGVGRGYLNDPERTGESYGQDPFRPEEGRLYRTGDLGRWREDGSMEFFGRRDHQVKVRGFRVELEEIDKAAGRHPAIKHAAVVDVREGGELQLYCHYETREPLAAEALRTFLAGLLPDYMVPMYFVHWDELPLTPNGKIDRHTLRARARTVLTEQRDEQAGGHVAPRTAVETRLRDVWAKVLQRPDLGVTEDFFAAGGDSMKAIRAVGEFGEGLLALDIFNHPTIEALARHFAERTRERSLLHLLGADVAEPQLSIVGIPHSAGDPVAFRAAAEALAALNPGCRLYAVALPREPVTDKGEALTVLQRTVASIADEIERKVNGPVFIFGQCNGSGLALAVGERLQAAGRTLVGVGIGGMLPRVKIEHDDDPFRERWSTKEITTFLGSLGATMPRDPDDVAFFLRDFRYDSGMANTYFNDCNRRIRDGQLTKLRSPLYCFIGVDDPVTPGYRRRAGAWHRLAEDVRLVEFPNLGHYLLRDQPQQFAEALDRVARAGHTGDVVPPPNLLQRLLLR